MVRTESVLALLGTHLALRHSGKTERPQFQTWGGNAIQRHLREAILPREEQIPSSISSKFRARWSHFESSRGKKDSLLPSTNDRLFLLRLLRKATVRAMESQ